MDHVNQKSKGTSLFNNYFIGILASLIGIFTPIILPILGSFIAPILFIGGMIAILKSEPKLWIRITTILAIIIPLIIFWKSYEKLVFDIILSTNQ